MFDNLQGPYVEQPNATVASTVRALVVTIFEQTCLLTEVYFDYIYKLFVF